MERPVTRLPEHADSMSIALISSSFSPLVLLNEDLTIIAASNSFCLAFDVDCTGVTGKKLADLGQGEWNVRQLDSLLRATVAGNASIEVYEMDLVRAGKETQCLLINAHTLDYFEAESIRVVLAITDVTSQRLADKVRDDLVRENSFCCTKSSIASQTAFKSSPACCCKARERCSRARPVSICATRTTA